MSSSRAPTWDTPHTPGDCRSLRDDGTWFDPQEQQDSGPVIGKQLAPEHDADRVVLVSFEPRQT